MCGEIGKHQYAKQVSMRLTTGADQNVVFSKTFEDVEQVWLDEIMITGFNGGTSASCYVNININGLAKSGINNENNPGMLVPVDVLNPHTVYSRPRVLAEGSLVNINSLSVSIRLPTGAAVALTEASICLTFVMRRPKEEDTAYRVQKNAETRAPSYRDPVRNSYNPAGFL